MRTDIETMVILIADLFVVPKVDFDERKIILFLNLSSYMLDSSTKEIETLGIRRGFKGLIEILTHAHTYHSRTHTYTYIPVCV